MKLNITYQFKNHSLFATASKSVRVDGKVRKDHQIYLGKVLDKEKGIYQNRKRGIFTYNPETGEFGSAPADFVPPRSGRQKVKTHLDFGDVYFLWRFVMGKPIKNAIEAISYGNMDTLWSVLFFYILCDAANCHALTWAQGSFISRLFPKANLSSQRISECLQAIGDDYSYKEFFAEYLKELKSCGEDEGTEILIDSTGLPNSIHFPLTAVNTHNGQTEEEIRLIYVTHQKTGLPIYFRYVAGNIVDVSTLERTLSHLKANGVNVKFSILDAGYYSENNLQVLKDEKISFLMRVRPNYKLYKRILQENKSDLESKKYAIMHKQRLIYIKRVECEPIPGYPCYAYLGLDTCERSSILKTKTANASVKNKSAADIVEEMENQGYFMMLSSRKIKTDQLLDLYYTRDQIEKVFGLGKSHCDLLPIRVESEEALRGHLLMTFIAAVILKELQQTLKKSGISLTSALMEMRNQKCSVYDTYAITDEPTKKERLLYEWIGIKKCPVEVEFPLSS